MSSRFDKLLALLRELFQLDQLDLDFGFYRLMHAKSAEVTRFLEQDLLPQVKAAFREYQSADKAALEKELAKAVVQAEGFGVDPETTQKVKDFRDYAFRLAPENPNNPRRIHFRLVDAVEGEHGNVKESNKRVFVPAAGDFVTEEEGPDGKELVIRFEYRPGGEDPERVDQDNLMLDTWKVRLIEEDFHRLMFEMEEQS